MFALSVSDPESQKPRRIELCAEKITIGSAETNDVVLRADGVATEHCVLERISQGFKLVDLHTESGTLVNGSHIAQKKIEAGDRIEIAGCSLVVEETAGELEPSHDARSSADPGGAPAAGGGSDSGGSSNRASSGQRRRRRAPFKTLLYTASIIVLFAGLLSFLAEMLPKKSADRPGGYRLEQARILLDNGDYATAKRLIGDLGRMGREVDQRRVSDLAERLDKDLFLREQALRDMQRLKDGDGRTTREQLERARELSSSYGYLPGMKADLDLRVRVLERAVFLESSKPVDTHDSLRSMSDQFLQARNYSGALNVWASLSRSDLATDMEVVASAREAVESAALVEARSLLSRVKNDVERGDMLSALIVLDDTELASFRGTEVYEQLETVAVELTDSMEEGADGPPTIRDGFLVARRAPDRGASKVVAPDAPETVRPSPAEGAWVELEYAIEQGDALFHEGSLGRALEVYQSALDSRLGFGERQSLVRRMERANRASWFLDALRNRIEEAPDRPASLVISSRNGDVSGRVTGINVDGLSIESENASESISAEDLAPSSVAALVRLYSFSPEDRLNLACYYLIDGNTDAANSAIKKAVADPSLKKAADSVIAFLRGMPDVPDWGFTLHEGEWVTFRERELAENQKKIDAALVKLNRNDEDSYRAGLQEVSALVPVAREQILELLRERRSRSIAELQEQPELVALDRVFDERRELGQRREAALEKIFDEVWYFYPYQPPDVPPDKATLYPKRQQEIDGLVDRVRDVWGKENEELGGGVNLSAKFKRLLERIRAEQKILASTDPDGFVEEEEFSVFRLLPANAKRINVRNIALDLDERKRLDRDMNVLRFNAETQNLALRQEVEQAWITNMYRRMMGRQAVLLQEKLVRAARGHCDWMSRSGKFSHMNDEDANLRTPGMRIKAQGYVAGGSGENIAINGSASGAHYAWLHSSGHHRNILFPSHQDLGVGNVGRYWCQNFAGGSEYSGNLGDL